jgi:hypothetical protein
MNGTQPKPSCKASVREIVRRYQSRRGHVFCKRSSFVLSLRIQLDTSQGSCLGAVHKQVHVGRITDRCCCAPHYTPRVPHWCPVLTWSLHHVKACNGLQLCSEIYQPEHLG